MNNASLELGGTNWAEKDGNILGYSVGDTSGKYSPQEFTFARGSNLSATRIDRAGLIVKGRENLLLYSNDFSNAAWSTSPITLTSGQSGYDGSNDAWEAEVAVNGNYQSLIQATNTSGLITNSIYAKAGNSNFLGITDSGGSGGSNCIFDLTDGSISYQNGGDFIETSSESIGNGWYRLKVTHQGTSPNYALWFVADASNSTQGTAGDSVFIQDAQQESSLVASPYIESGATNGTAGVLENTPRLNYTTGVANPYLLLEPSRTNLFSQSEYFGSSYWTKSGASVVSGFTSPEGLSNAYKLVEDTSTGGHQIFRRIVVTATDNYASLYAKPSGRDWIVLYDTYRDQGRYFNISTGVIGGVYRFAPVSEFIEPFQNGYYRIGIGVTSSTIDYQLQVLLADSDGGAVYTGDGTSGAYIYGAQLEAGSYPTSYIPTYSVSATRAQDVCNKLDASDLIGTEFTLFFDGYQSIESQYSRYIVLKGTAGTYVNFISIETNPNNKVGVNVNAGSSVFTATTQRTSGERLKMALRCKDNDFAFYINGVLIKSQTSGSVPVTSDLYLGYYTDYAENYNVINQTQIYKEALTNAELATLTTI